MREKIYTIPVNEAFEKQDGCPFCTLYSKLEDTEIDLITGASMMEPDIRIKTNQLGFCRKHFDIMLKSGKKLPVALTIQSHLDSLKKEVTPGGLFAMDDPAKPIKRIEKLNSDCYVCQRIDRHFSAMFETACILFEGEQEFRDKFTSQPFFCLPHYARLLESSKKVNSKKRHSELVKAAGEIVEGYLNSLYDDVSLFCKKFDYNSKDIPWGNSKDSSERAVNFLKSVE